MANGKGWRRGKGLTISSLILTAVVIAGLAVIYFRTSTTVVLVVRHGEKAATTCSGTLALNYELSAAGQARAEALKHVGEDTGIQAIYASEYCRTHQTVQPIATQLGLTINDVNQHPGGSANVDDLIARVWSDNTGQAVLIAGHTDTVPLIIERLGGGTISPIGDEEYDNLYVITIYRWWFFRQRTTVVHLKYGVPS